jgi:pimeloyl-ACP methyl ester carboxylesterase
VTDDTLPIYLLPGMTPQYPVYSRLLPLLPNAQVVPFIEPEPNESLTDYAKRMAPQFPDRCFIGGVSFGGILAQEISRIVHPAGCIVIASIQRPSQLPPWLRLWRLLGGRHASRVLNAVGSSAKCVPTSIRTSSTARLTKLSGDSGKWHRWATSAVLDWSPSTPIAAPILHIHGDADTTFPVRYTKPDIVIQHGRHALPMSHPIETANVINDFTRAA